MIDCLSFLTSDTDQDFVALEIVLKENGCFEGRLKMGMHFIIYIRLLILGPISDASELSEQKFSVGNSQSGSAYIKTFHTLYLDVCFAQIVFIA